MSDEQTEERHVRPFAEFLQRQSRGATHRELSEGLHQLVARVQETSKKGTLTLTVKVEPSRDGRTLIVTDAIVLKLPEHDRQPSLWWQDSHGNLTRSDPEQLAMDVPLREVVDTATGEIREVAL
jgi:hypothetical protein